MEWEDYLRRVKSTISDIQILADNINERTWWEQVDRMRHGLTDLQENLRHLERSVEDAIEEAGEK